MKTVLTSDPISNMQVLQESGWTFERIRVFAVETVSVYTRPAVDCRQTGSAKRTEMTLVYPDRVRFLGANAIHVGEAL